MVAAEDGIDESAWLPRGTPPVNAFRMAKGDLSHDGTSVRVKSQRDKMFERKIIDDHQLWTANTLATLYEVAFRFLSFRRRIRDAIDERLANNEDMPPPMDMFVRVMRSLRPHQRNIVIRVTVETLRPNDFLWLYECRGSVQETFEQAGRTLEELMAPKKPIDSIHDRP